MGQEPMSTPVQAFLSQHVVARREHSQQRSRDRRHATGCDQRRLGIFERRQLCVEHIVIRRVVQPDVFRIVISELRPVRLYFKSYRLKDWENYGALDQSLRLARMNQLSIKSM